MADHSQYIARWGKKWYDKAHRSQTISRR